MAQKLNDFYEQAKALGGMKARMRLAVITGIPSSKAGDVPDSAENIAKFNSALAELKKEFK